MKIKTEFSLLIRGAGRITASPLGLRLAESALEAFGELPQERRGGFVEVDLGGRGADECFAVKSGGRRLSWRVVLKPRRYRLMSRERTRAFFSEVAHVSLNASEKAVPWSSGGSGQAAARPAPKVLIFRSLLNSEFDAKPSLHQASWYLASALRAAGAQVVFSDLKLSFSGENFEQGPELARLLSANADLDFAALTLSESYFRGAEKLARFIKAKVPGCRIAVGGIMPSKHPFHVLANLPSADLLVRGDGEEVFPRAVSILSGPLPAAVAERELMGLNGLIYRDGSKIILSGIGLSNTVPDLERGFLDFGLLTRKDVAGGGTMYLSRGCLNSCNFCVSLNKGRYRAVSVAKAREWLKAYKERVLELFGTGAPPHCFGVGFYDDDFFADKERALAILDLIKRSGLYVEFSQTGIKTFFKRGRLDTAFFKRLNNYVFQGHGAGTGYKTDMFIGTENFCDRELLTLGKGYLFSEVKLVAEALSARKIRQSHHLILCNVFTKAADLRENIAAMAALNKTCSPYFNILRPGRLFSFFETASYRKAVAAGLVDYINVRDVLSVPGFKEYEYPLVGGDSPADREADRLLSAAPSRLSPVVT